MTDQEKALLEIGPTHTALMAVSILGTLVFIYQTEWADHVNGLGVVFALLAAWASAAIEAQKRVKNGESTGKRLSAIPSFSRVHAKAHEKRNLRHSARSSRDELGWRRYSWPDVVGVLFDDDCTGERADRRQR